MKKRSASSLTCEYNVFTSQVSMDVSYDRSKHISHQENKIWRADIIYLRLNANT